MPGAPVVALAEPAHAPGMFAPLTAEGARADNLHVFRRFVGQGEPIVVVPRLTSVLVDPRTA